MTSRIATFAAVAVLGVGTSGAIALAGKTSSAGPRGGAAVSQYWPGKGCGDRNHDHPPSTVDPCPPLTAGTNGTDHRQSRGDSGHGQPHPSGSQTH